MCIHPNFMRLILSLIVFLFLNSCVGQGLVHVGDQLPRYHFTSIINAPVTEIELQSQKMNRPIVLVFWGTWCAPCIPEMINFSSLQNKFGDQVLFIGVSNDNEQKLKNFLKKRQ